jgi:hypothetical protein
MARKSRTLPSEINVTQLISTGLLASICPRKLVEKVLRDTGKESVRERLLPAPAVVYYIMAMALWRTAPLEEVFRVVCQGLQWLSFSTKKKLSTSVTKGALSRARTRLGQEVMRKLAEKVLKPIAQEGDLGAWYNEMRVMALDGTTMDVPDEAANAEYFGYPSSSRGDTAFPQVRILSLVECGTHVVIGAEMGPYRLSEQKMAAMLLPNNLSPDMLLLADRNFYGYNLWNLAADKASLLWRIKSNLILPVEKRLPDGSFLSRVYDGHDSKRLDGVAVRVIEYQLEGTQSTEIYRMLTNILDFKLASAKELAALYHERWEIENVFAELKVGLGFSTLLRSKTPELVQQEIWGFLMAHFAVRQLMAKAAWDRDLDPDVLSFTKSLRAIKLKLPQAAGFPPLED